LNHLLLCTIALTAMTVSAVALYCFIVNYCRCSCSFFYCCFEIILQERESRRQKFLQDMAAGRLESRLLRYMPAMTTDVVSVDEATTICSSQQPDADIDITSLSSAERRAMLLSRIHSRRFRELVLWWYFIAMAVYILLTCLMITVSVSRSTVYTEHALQRAQVSFLMNQDSLTWLLAASGWSWTVVDRHKSYSLSVKSVIHR